MQKLVNNKLVTLTEEEEAALIAQSALPDTTPYDKKRRMEYPTIGDQLDMLWHAVDTGDWTPTKVKTTEFYTALKAVKDAHPKPQE